MILDLLSGQDLTGRKEELLKLWKFFVAGGFWRLFFGDFLWVGFGGVRGKREGEIQEMLV